MVHEHLAFPERQFVSAAEVNDLAEIEVGQRVVEFWTQTRDSNGPERVGVGSVQQIAGIRHRL